jgi:peptide/nickel transport system permease protein
VISAAVERIVGREPAPGGRPNRRAWERFRSHRLAVLGSGVLALLGALAIFAPWVTPYSPTAIDLHQVTAAPTLAHPLGTDELGRDVLTRVLFGGRISLLVGLFSMLIATSVGVAYGTVAGYYGGRLDTLLMRGVDFLLSFPSIFVLLILASFYSNSVLNVILYIGLFGWMGMARLVRGQVLSLREMEFVVAARSLGAGGGRIIRSHLLPNAVAPVIVAATLGVGGAILIEAVLDFLGFGVPPDTPTWGNLMTNGQSYFLTTPLLAIAPGLVITAAVTSINFMGDALRDALDPHSVGRSAQDDGAAGRPRAQ